MLFSCSRRYTQRVSYYDIKGPLKTGVSFDTDFTRVLNYGQLFDGKNDSKGVCYMAKNRVLVVDDEPDVLMLTCTALEDAGYDVIRAKDVPQARKLLLSEIPDLIVTDIMMPEESGFSLIKFIRENSGIKNTPIIVTSVLDSESEIFQQGADAYLPKPFTPEELIKMVTDLVNRE